MQSIESSIIQSIELIVVAKFYKISRLGFSILVFCCPDMKLRTLFILVAHAFVALAR